MSPADDVAAAPATSGAEAPAPLPPRARVLVGAVLALFVGLGLWGAWGKSETYDEPFYLMSAYSYVTHADFSLNREHPPLAKLLMGLPLLALDLELPDDHQQQPGIPYSFYAHQPRVAPQTILFLARLPGLLLGLVLGLYVLRWARVAFGDTAGLWALALTLLNPNVLAHSRVAANDMAPVVFLLACSYHAWRWLDTGSRRSLLFTAVTLGLALGSKLSALLMLPVLGLLVLGVALARRRPTILLQGLLAAVAAGGVLHLVYLGEMRTLGEAREHVRFDAPDGRAFKDERIEAGLEAVFGTDTPIPLMSFLKGLDHQMGHNATGHITYFWGEANTTGSWAFFVVATLLKNPEGLVFLILLGALAWRRTWRGGVHEACLLGVALLHYLALSSADVQLGFKYALAVVPFLAIFASRAFAPQAALARSPRLVALLVLGVAVAAELVFVEPEVRAVDEWLPLLFAGGAAGLLAFGRADAPRRWALACALFGVWGLGDALSRQPHNLMYFNRWAGGPGHGHHYFVVGDDWGQDTALLGRWMEQRGLDWIRYDYYGTADPEAWGVRSAPSGLSSSWEPEPGLFAVHVAILHRVPHYYTWLEGLTPLERLGGTIHVYELTPEHIASWRARKAAASG